MKKFTLVSLFALQLVFVSAFSQSIHLYTQKGQDVTGATIHVYCNYMNTYELPFNVENTLDTVGAFKVRKEEKYVADGSSINFCWKDCYGESTRVSEPVTYKAHETKEKGFYADFYPLFSEGDSYVHYVFFNANDLSDSSSIDVFYHASSEEIDSVVVIAKTIGIKNNADDFFYQSIYPNPTNGLSSVAYMIDNKFSKAMYVVTNMLGEIVIEMPVNSEESVVDLDLTNLNNGFYFGSLVVDGKMSHSEKIVVKH